VQIREKEVDIDVLITPIEDMYNLLLRYEVRGSCCTACLQRPCACFCAAMYAFHRQL
jgi:hypothetical protein